MRNIEENESLEDNKKIKNDKIVNFNNDNSNKQFIAIKVGLKNIGKTCYMNSTIQCLSNSAKLTYNFLPKFKYDKNDNNKKISNEFYKVLKSLWNPSNDNKPYSP